MPLGGARIWRIAANEFNKVKLPYWRDVCEFFASRYEKITDLRTLLQTEIMDNELMEKDKKFKRDYSKVPTKNVLSVRHPYWRYVATRCPKLGHIIQHHEFQCKTQGCSRLEDTADHSRLRLQNGC